jgi:hypothetical protein
MFEILNEFLNDFDDENESINVMSTKKKKKLVNSSISIVGMEKFPFFEAALL